MFDRNKVTAEERTLAKKLLAFSSAAKVPLSFTVDGVNTNGLPDNTKPVVRSVFCNSEIGLTAVSAMAARGMSVEVRGTEYKDFPAAEWSADMTNRSYKSSGILSYFALNGFIPGSYPEISVGNGDTGDENAYLRRSNIPLNRKTIISPFGVLSSSGASPFIVLSFREYSLLFAVGWPGKWKLELENRGSGVRYSLSQDKISISVLPLETISTPSLTLMLWRGDMTRGINIWRRFYFKHILPLLPDGGVPEPCCILKIPADAESISEDSLTEAIEKYVGSGIFPDVWAVDAGWYICGGNPENTGDWYADPDRFPDGLSPIAEKCRRYGIKLLVWFAPETAAADSRFGYLHPEWLLSSSGENGSGGKRLVKLCDGECAASLLDTLSRIVKAGHIDIYRHDCTLHPDMFFKENEAPDRIGASENLYARGLLSLLDGMKARIPELLIDAGAFGGMRNDLDILRRSLPLSCCASCDGDILCQLRRYHELFSFTPYFSVRAVLFGGAAGAEEYACISSMAPVLEIAAASDDMDALAGLWKKFEPVREKAARYELEGDYYPLNDCLDGWYAVQFDSPRDGSGFINVIRTVGAEEGHISVKPFLRENAKYTFKNPFTGEIKRGDGTALAAGFTFHMPERSGEVWFYTSEEKKL